MRALVVTNMYPTAAAPATGTFVAAQVASLCDAGVEIELLHIDRDAGGRHVYRGLGDTVTKLVQAGDHDLVHAMYGGVMADVVTRVVRDRPVLVSFCGTDMHGGMGNGVFETLSLRYGVRASHRAARRAAGVIVKSRNLFDALPRSVDLSRVWIVPNGVDLARFRPRDRSECRRALGWDAARTHVLFPALPQRPEKRFALATAAVARLNRSAAHIELHALERVPHDDVPLWVNAASAVLLTSVDEGSPNAVKEALACNVPVVSVDVGDVRERIAGIDGCFIAAPTAEDLAANLGRALEREAPIAGRERVAEVSLERIAEKVLEIYVQLTAALATRRSRAAARRTAAAG
jgi:glycosyltransferase involved in cell wall biosynthesis